MKILSPAFMGHADFRLASLGIPHYLEADGGPDLNQLLDDFYNTHAQKESTKK